MKPYASLLFLLLIALTTLTVPSSTYTNHTDKNYLSHAKLVREQYFSDPIYIKWYSGDVYGSYDLSTRYIYLVNISTGERRYYPLIEHFYYFPHKLIVLDGKHILVLVKTASMENSSILLLDIDNNEIFWEKDGYIRWITTILYSRGYLIAENQSHIQVINVFNGDIIKTIDIRSLTGGFTGGFRPFLIRSNYVFFTIHTVTRTYLGFIDLTTLNYGYLPIVSGWTYLDIDPYYKLVGIWNKTSEKLFILDLVSGREIHEFYLPTSGSFHISSRYHVLIRNKNSEVILYRLSNLDESKTLYRAPWRHIYTALSDDERYLAIMDMGSLIVYDLSNYQIIYKQESSFYEIRDLVWLNHRNLVVYGISPNYMDRVIHYGLNGTWRIIDLAYYYRWWFIKENTIYRYDTISEEKGLFTAHDLRSGRLKVFTEINLTSWSGKLIVFGDYFVTIGKQDSGSQERFYVLAYNYQNGQLWKNISTDLDLEHMKFIGIDNNYILGYIFSPFNGVILYKIDISNGNIEELMKLNELLNIPIIYVYMDIAKDPYSDRIAVAAGNFFKNRSSFHIIDLNSKNILTNISIDAKFNGKIRWSRHGIIATAFNKGFLLVDPDNYNHTFIYADLEHPIGGLAIDPSFTHIAVYTGFPNNHLKIYRIRGEHIGQSATTETVTTTETITHTATSTETTTKTIYLNNTSTIINTISNNISTTTNIPFDLNPVLIVIIIILLAVIAYLLVSRRRR